MSDKVKNAAEHAKDVAAKRKAEMGTATDKAEAFVKEHAAKAKERLAERPPGPGGQAS
jgi:hypothetical protein